MRMGIESDENGPASQKKVRQQSFSKSMNGYTKPM